jgi:hypothetical protein
MRRSVLLASIAVLPLACLSVGAQLPSGERVLDHSDYDRWQTIEQTRLSRRGGWLSYRLQPPGEGDATLVFRATTGDREHSIERGQSARVSYDERHGACLVKPEREAVRALRKDDEKEEQLPKNQLALLELESGSSETLERVKSFRMPKRAGGRLAWLHEKPLDDDEEDEKEDEAGDEEESEEAEEESEEKEEPEELTPEERADKKRRDKQKKARKDGTELVARDLGTGREWRFENVLEYAWSEDGRWLAMTTSTKKDGGDGVVLLDVSNDTTARWNTGLTGEEPEGEYKSLAFDEGSTQLAYLSNADAYDADPPAWSLYVHRLGQDEFHAIKPGDPRVAAGWGVSPHEAPEFSKDGARLFLATRPLPRPEPEELLKEDRVVVDVWSWTDDLIQPHQLEELDDERKRDYSAVLLIGSGHGLVQLGRLDMPEVQRPRAGDGATFLGRSDLPYRRMASWDTQVFADGWAVDVASGQRRALFTQTRGRHRLSPGTRYAYWWDAEGRTWRAQSTAGGAALDLCAGIPHRFDNELHDSPALPGSYGVAGWLAGDEALLVYDRFDVWRVDPGGEAEPVCVTDGLGRARGLRLRVVDLDREEQALDPSAPLLLSAFDETNKDAGFFSDSLEVAGEPRELVLSAHRYSTPTRAEEGELVSYTRSTFAEFPDLWLADADLGDARKVSDANPQQAEYAWGTAELVEWTSTDGTPLQGILYKPPGFDPSKRYPMLTYFYERTSDRLHDYSPPTPHRSIIRFSFYASRGYLVFAPDIPYQIGYPGQSALHAVLPGVTQLIGRGFVDEDAIGVQGHSWGGYQAAYLITQTDLFAAAVAGAVVSNMTSAYGGVRWGSGMSRMFQYEKTQSRIGGTLWEATSKYLDNSPLFYADRVSTPLLMMHNDHDGAVPWYQGIEFFLALRRLDRPVWMLNYNDQPHWVTTWATQKDYARRMQQFFDHHLKGAPAAEWMITGVPALEKGRSLGLDPVSAE